MTENAPFRATVGSLLAVATFVLMGACAAGEGGSRPPQVGQAAPSYRAATIAGDSVALSDLRGHPVVVNVWATWCAPCRSETPFLQSLYEAHEADGLRVLGISVDQRGSLEAVRSFLDEHEVTYTTLVDPEMRAMDTFYVLGLPTTLLVDRSGTVRLIRTGPVSEDDQEFLTALREALS